jgi:hypothetical protein
MISEGFWFFSSVGGCDGAFKAIEIGSLHVLGTFEVTWHSLISQKIFFFQDSGISFVGVGLKTDFGRYEVWS